MKTLIATAAILFSINASAEIVKTPCQFQDYQKLNGSLENMGVRKGVEFRDELKDVLQQEMGPVCNSVVDTEKIVMIPGRSIRRYEIVTAASKYNVSIVNDMESRSSWMSIEKLEN